MLASWPVSALADFSDKKRGGVTALSEAWTRSRAAQVLVKAEVIPETFLHIVN